MKLLSAYITSAFLAFLPATVLATPRLVDSRDVTVGGFSSIGCFTEGYPGLALADKKYNSHSMTLEKCALKCVGFRYFGVENQRQCFCGNVLSEGSLPAPTTDCTTKCIGNSLQTCGGQNRLNVYQSEPTPPAPTSTASPSPPSCVPLGCYSEPSNTQALDKKAYINDLMTVPMCAAFCVGYNFFGVEHGDECYCGDILNTGSLPIASTKCELHCKGDKNTFCGGRRRLSLFQCASTPSSMSSSSTSSISTATSSSIASTTSFTLTTSIVSSSSSSSAAASSSTAPVCSFTSPINNGGFEDIPDSSWSFDYVGSGSGAFSINAIQPHSGLQRAKASMTYNDGITSISQYINVCPGQTYNFSGWARRLSSTGGYTCQVSYKLDGMLIVKSTLSTVPGQMILWVESTGSIVAPSASPVLFAMEVDCVNAPGISTTFVLFLDDVSLTLA